ncbi:MAG: DUF6288 domain-containing protein, partial [Verrucomicrobiota bacterium]
MKPILTSLLLFILPSPSQAAPPDLTASGVIATIDKSESYNLGATGLRGWIYVNRDHVGDIGLMTDASRQILVTTASAPASPAIQANDVILGAIAASSGTVPFFTTDCRKAFATAIGDAEKTGAGTLRVKLWRAGTTTDVNISMTIMGNYSTTAPYTCPKSSLILANARNKFVSQLLANEPILVDDYHGAIHGLALLASVKSGDPNYAEVQTRLQTYARARASQGPLRRGLSIWDWSYTCMFLAEYYILTGDSQVVPGLKNFTLKLAESQSMYGTFGHDPSAFKLDGSGQRISIGYGPINSIGVASNAAILIGKKALLLANQTIDPEIDEAIDRGSKFFAFYVNKGSIPYGEHSPEASNHASNGKDQMAAVLFGLQANREVETEYYTRMSIASWIGREYGHTGQGFSFMWAALGANMGGTLAAAEHVKKVSWHYDLSRRTDGSFTYDGQEQYGMGTTSDGTYLGSSHHFWMNPTAMYLLTYSLPLQRLHITGKSLNPAYALDATKVANAVAAASYKIDRASRTVAQLITDLNQFDPVVRNYAAAELAGRTLTAGELTTLRNLLSSANANERQGACQTLGARQDATALPTIVLRLNDSDLWVRAIAAKAIRSYASNTASTHLTAMINSFIANATDPDHINWIDPIQISNRFLSMVIFGNGVPDGAPGNDVAAYTVNASKSLLYPALQIGLKQPDSYPRTGVAVFCRQRLPLTDVQALIPDMFEVVTSESQADRMWSASPRAEGIRMLANFKIAEGIPIALSMLDTKPEFGWGSGEYLTAALESLATYGDAARYTLPTLKSYLATWDTTQSTYALLVETIATIENAITAPAQNLGLAAAHSQTVTTSIGIPKAITLSGASPRTAITYTNLTQPAHGILTGSAPDLTYTPALGYSGIDHFTFQTTDSLTTSLTATVSIIVGTPGNGLKGEYFDNSDFTILKHTRTDPQINFDWGTGQPHSSVAADTFSVRWTGLLLIPESGHYTFSALTSDGVRLYVNGQLIMDRFADQSTKWNDSTSIYLTAGQLADLQMEYYENTGSAVAKLKWMGPSLAGVNGQIIPQSYLFDGSGISNRAAFAFPQSLSTPVNTALPITLSGSGGILSHSIVSAPANGTLSGTLPNVTYTPNDNFNGTDSFTFLVNNGMNNSAPATVSISVQAGTLTNFTWLNATTGNWNTSENWTPNVPATAGQPYYALNFPASGGNHIYTTTHNLTNAFKLNQLNASAEVTIGGTQSIAFTANGGTLPQLNQNSVHTLTINSPLTLSATTTFGGTATGRVTINSAISGAGGLIKNSAGTLDIKSVSNTFSGGTIINQGVLLMNAEANQALGTGAITLNGGTLYLERINASNALIINGGTLHADNGFGNQWNGSITLNANLNLTSPSYGTLAINNSISGSGGMTLNGDGPVVLQVANSYTGATSVNTGSLVCNHVNALGTGPLNITTGATVNLNYTGTRTIAALTYDNGTLLAPGTYGSTASPATNKNNTYFSGTGTVTVLSPTTTALSLTSGSNPANSGAPLIFTATVTGTSPTGNVSFYSGNALLGTAAVNGSSQANFPTANLAIGPHSITARYIGNSTNAPSQSNAVPIIINSTPTSAPTNLQATPVSNRIDLSWSATGGATSYYVKRSLTNGGPYTVIG